MIIFVVFFSLCSKPDNDVIPASDEDSDVVMTSQDTVASGGEVAVGVGGGAGAGTDIREEFEDSRGEDADFLASQVQTFSDDDEM